MAGRDARFVVTRWSVALAAALFAACSGSSVTAGPSTSPPVFVTVDGATQPIRPGTTFRQIVRELNLHPGNGRLLSVSGTVLSRRADPGEVLLNGQPAARRASLASGDAITVVDGTDRTEGTKRVVKDLKGYRYGDPQLTLRRYRMRQIEDVGRVSGEVRSVTYRPLGRPKVPRAVALTFDDGPWGKQTLRLLRVLKRFRARATFFMVGSQVEEYPRVARKVRHAGMRVGNHSWSHPENPPFADLPANRLHNEIAGTDVILRRVGDHPSLFRPPGGSYDGEVIQEARSNGLRVVTWSVDPQDWRASRSPREIAHIVLANVRPGSIVLLHDGGGDQSATIQALPAIIRGIRKMGLRLVTIPP